MKNRFFSVALKKAAAIAGKPGRLMLLLSKLAFKLRDVNWKEVDGVQAKEKFFTLGRIVKSYAMGHYREIPWKTILLIIGAVIYFVNPIDILPDLIPVAGLTDDFGVLLWVYNSVNGEINKFIAWEKSRITV
jgi:uncharacterized membrane protein YkvA (DUF1232 family)